ncbi:hypothetical protein [Cobetia sp. MB87]|uniref:GumC family protein n=1 Tax=Cobetia sp. MB87 TaxID=2588451 RepID=UPI00140C8496|nr:hypothetical protein [Cobetia sp. MB87]NHH86259.1 Chromosome partition protein Smc [Cobetia sp. MB87]
MTESRSSDTPKATAKPSLGRRILGVLLGWAARGSSMRPRTRRAAYLLLATAILSVIWGLTIAFIAVAPVTYTTSWTMILPGTGSGLSVNFESIGQASTSANSSYSSSSLDPKVNYRAIAESPAVLERAASTVDMHPDDYGKPKIKLTDQTALIAFQTSAPSAKAALARANAHIDAFNEVIEQLRNDEQARREAVIRRSLETYDRTLKETQRKLLEFQSTSGLVSMEQFKELTLSVEALKDTLETRDGELSALNARLATLSSRLGLDAGQAGGVIALQRDARYQALLTQAAEQAASLDEARGKWGERNPEVINLAAGLDALERSLASRMRQLLPRQTSRIQNALRAASGHANQDTLVGELITLDTQRRGVISELATGRANLAARQQRLDNSVAKAAQLQDLLREQQVATAVYTTALAKIDIGQIDPFASYPMLQILDPPPLPEKADSLGIKLAIVGALAASVFSIIGLILLWIRKPYLLRLQQSV